MIAAIVAGILSLAVSLLAGWFQPDSEFPGLGRLAIVFLFVSFFLILWFPSMVVGLVVSRKNLSPAQIASHILVTVISGFVFVITAIYVSSLISQR
jgi:hypothetical protein